MGSKSLRDFRETGPSHSSPTLSWSVGLHETKNLYLYLVFSFCLEVKMGPVVGPSKKQKAIQTERNICGCLMSILR